MRCRYVGVFAKCVCVMRLCASFVYCVWISGYTLRVVHVGGCRGVGCVMCVWVFVAECMSTCVCACLCVL